MEGRKSWEKILFRDLHCGKLTTQTKQADVLLAHALPNSTEQTNAPGH